MLDYIERARRRHRAGLHHLGRPGSPRAAGGARRLPPGAVAHEERRGAYLPGHPARLHDAGRTEGLRSRRRATSRCSGRSRSSTGCAAAARRCARRRSVGCCTAVTATPTSLFGRRMTRVEDEPLLRGQRPFRRRPGYSRRAACRVPAQPGGAWAIEGHRRERGEGAARRPCGADLRRSAAAAHLATASRRRCRPARSASMSILCAGQGRSHLRRRAGRDGGGREPPHRRGRAGADRARPRGVAGGDSIRSRGSRPARPRRGSTARTISSRGRASTTATSTARSPRPRIASPSTSACTRAAAIRSRRAASRCGSIRSTSADRARQHPGAAPRPANPGRGAGPLRAAASASSRPTPAAASDRRRRSIPRSWRCRRRRCCCAGR